MPTYTYTLPSSLNAGDVIGVTPADHHILSGSTIPGFREADLAGHPQQAFTDRGKIRPTVYFSNGARFTQSHKTKDNIGYHPPAGDHLFFGNVDQDEFWKAYEERNKDPATFRKLLISYIDKDNQPCRPTAPRQDESFQGRMLLEIYKTTIHPSRSAIVAVTYQQAQEIVKSLRARSEEKLQFETTEEWYFGDL